MDQVVERCAGLDVHQASITACVRYPSEAGERRQEIRTFCTTTAGLVTLRDWLASFAVTLVGIGVHRGLLEAGRAPRGATQPSGKEGVPPVACHSRLLKLGAARAWRHR
jgi:hypothetical protein